MYLTNLFPYWHHMDNPPEKSCTVLIYYKDSRGGNYVVATYTREHTWWFPGSDKNDYEIIAWQELPNKPLFKEHKNETI